MIISRLSNANPRIPKELKQTYEHLVGIALGTRRASNELEVLFNGSREAIDLMNQTAPEFFVHHQELLSDHIILSISRLTDNKRSGTRNNPQENLTLDCLLDHEPKGGELHKMLKQIRTNAKPVRLYRHKVLAHLSQEHRLKPSPKLAEDISLKLIRDLLYQIDDFLLAFECSFTKIRIEAPLNCPGSFGDASALLEYLKLGVDAEKKQNEELKRHTALAV
jgi:HEPN superfamily AbiU2-like protein